MASIFVHIHVWIVSGNLLGSLALLVHSFSPTAERDQGDLGLVPRAGNAQASAAIASAGFAVTEAGGFAPEPIRVDTVVPAARRRRAQTRTTWHLVQNLGTVPATQLAFERVHDVIAHRVAFGPYQAARAVST